MLRGVRGGLVCLLGAALAGCGPHFTRAYFAPKPAAPELPVVGRTALRPDVSALPGDTPHVPLARPAQYRRLTAEECRTLAIRNAPLADDLDRHPDNVPTSHPHFHPLKPSPAEAEASRLVRGTAADELRNRAAGDALDEYFRLAQAEGQFDLLAVAHAELRTQLAAAEAAERRGLRDRADIDGLRVQLLGTEARAAQLETAIGSLNASLRARLALPAADPLPLWPADPLRVKPDEVDVEEAVRTGLHYRPDLNVLRALLTDDGTASADLARATLGGLSPLLVAKPSLLLDVVGVLKKKANKNAAALQAQVASVLAGRERQAEAEIRAAVATLHGNRAAATAKAAEVRRLTLKVDELRKKEAAGLQVTAELLKAKLDLLQARGDVLKAATDWNAAEVKLRQAMGVLVRD